MLSSLWKSVESAIRSIWTIAQLQPFETATVVGRSRERYRRALLTTLASGVSRLTNILVLLISVPLTLKYLGTERYGLWMTISSVIAILGFSDLGISNGLLNGISKAHGTEDHELARQYVSSAFFFLTGVAFAMGVCFSIAYSFISWRSLFHISSPLALAEAGPAVATFVACFLLGIPISIVNRVQSGYQQGFVTNLWSAAGSIVALASVLLVIRLHGSLMWLVLAISGAPLLAQLANGIALFGVECIWLLPKWSYVTADVSRALLHSGFSFFVLQLATAVAFSSDNVVLAQVMGPEAVTQYSVPTRLFSLVATFCSIILTPLWPAYGEALIRMDHQWIRRTLLRSIALCLAASVAIGLVLITFGTRIIHLWAGPQIMPSRTLLIGLAIWSILTALSMAFATFFNGASLLSFAVKVSIGGAITNIALSIYLTYRIGIPGVVYGSILSQTFFVIIPYLLYLRRYFTTHTAVV
jgi:O-antigen/teichoic acid export membrane protein